MKWSSRNDNDDFIHTFATCLKNYIRFVWLAFGNGIKKPVSSVLAACAFSFQLKKNAFSIQSLSFQCVLFFAFSLWIRRQFAVLPHLYPMLIDALALSLSLWLHTTINQPLPCQLYNELYISITNTHPISHHTQPFDGTHKKKPEAFVKCDYEKQRTIYESQIHQHYLLAIGAHIRRPRVTQNNNNNNSGVGSSSNKILLRILILVEYSFFYKLI